MFDPSNKDRPHFTPDGKVLGLSAMTKVVERHRGAGIPHE